MNNDLPPAYDTIYPVNSGAPSAPLASYDDLYPSSTFVYAEKIPTTDLPPAYSTLYPTTDLPPAYQFSNPTPAAKFSSPTIVTPVNNYSSNTTQNTNSTFFHTNNSQKFDDDFDKFQKESEKRHQEFKNNFAKFLQESNIQAVAYQINQMELKLKTFINKVVYLLSLNKSMPTEDSVGFFGASFELLISGLNTDNFSDFTAEGSQNLTLKRLENKTDYLLKVAKDFKSKLDGYEAIYSHGYYSQYPIVKMVSQMSAIPVNTYTSVFGLGFSLVADSFIGHSSYNQNEANGQINQDMRITRMSNSIQALNSYLEKLSDVIENNLETAIKTNDYLNAAVIIDFCEIEEINEKLFNMLKNKTSDEMIKAIFSKKIDVLKIKQNGEDLLKYKIINYPQEALKIMDFVNHSADSAKYYESTHLMEAIKSGDAKLVQKALIVFPEQLSHIQSEALGFFGWIGYCFSTLIHLGRPEHKGNTALHLAYKTGNQEIIDMVYNKMSTLSHDTIDVKDETDHLAAFYYHASDNVMGKNLDHCGNDLH